MNNKPEDIIDVQFGRAEFNSLLRVVGYVIENEKRHWEEGDGFITTGHIYEDGVNVKTAIARKHNDVLRGVPVMDWAEAIAQRVSDEWGGKGGFPESSAILRDVLFRLLANNPAECMALIGTGIIEATFFDEVS